MIDTTLLEDEDSPPREYGDEYLEKALRAVAESPTKFCHALLDFKPFPYQAELLEDPSKRIVICAGRQVGKSLIVAAKALWFAFTHPNTSTYIVAATQRQSMLMFDKLTDYVDASTLVQESVTRRTRTQLHFTNKSKIVALPCGRRGKTLRGATADMIVVDEASFVPQDVILDVLMPMLATTNGPMIMMSTPFGRDHFFYSAFNSPSWSRYKFKTSDNPIVTKEFMDGQMEMLGPRRFAQEYLAEFVDDEKTYFPMELIRTCVHVCENEHCIFCDTISGKLKPSGELIAAYDPGGLTDPAALVVVQRSKKIDPHGKETTVFKVVLLRTYLAKKAKQGASNSADEVYSRFNAEIADLHKQLHFHSLIVDSTGIGKPIVEHCKQLGLPADGVNLNMKFQEEIFSNLKLLMEEGKIELPDNMDLLSSLNCIIANRTRIGGYVFDHPSGSHDDLAYALALAVWKTGKGRPTVVANFS